MTDIKTAQNTLVKGFEQFFNSHPVGIAFSAASLRF